MKINIRAASLALILMFAASIILVQFPGGISQTTNAKATYAYIGAVPNPVNVGGEVLLHLGITDAISGVNNGFTGLTVTVTNPDNKTQTLGPFKTDSTGGTGTVYVPTMIGDYTFQTNFPEQVFGTTNYKASTSNKLIVTVVEEQPAYYPDFPLPKEYWTRPIDPQIREWYTIAGSWLVSSPDNLYVPYNDAPESAHVLWTKPLTTGGLVGGNLGMQDSMNQGPVAFETGDAYQGKWSSRFIIAGVLIYTHHTSVRPLEYTAVNIRTGETLWTKTFLDNRSITMCQTFYWQSYNYMGTYSYIWVTSGNDWYAFDPFDGKLRITITNMPTGTTVVGERGEIYRYSISTTTGRFLLWNMSALISMEGSFLGPGPSTYNASATTTSGALTTAAQRAYSLNFTFSTGLTGSVQRVWLNDRFIGAQLNTTHVRIWGISLVSGQEGIKLFDNTWNAPSDWASGNQTVQWMAWSQEDKVATAFSKETCQNYGFSLETGKLLWGPTEPEYYLNALDDTKSNARAIAYGKLYSASVSGIVYCYDVKTGELLWTHDVVDPYTEILWANSWWVKPLFISDGKIYVAHLEHSANMPFPRGAPAVCLNATTGEEIWRIDGMFRSTRWGGRAIMGDSVIATMDTYDQRIYAIGKGPSAMTVSAPDSGVMVGGNLVIRGTVTDISPGTTDYAITSRFPAGVPAVSDESQSDWMLYVYKQFTKPSNATGVPVTVGVLDSNGNYREIGTTTTNDGFFTISWQPDIPGEFTVYASFAGSSAYYPCQAITSFVADEVPPISPTPEPLKLSTMTDTYILAIGIATILTIVIIGLVILMQVRKHSVIFSAKDQ